MNIPSQGTYQARANGQIVIYVTEKTGSLCAAIPLATIDANPAWNGKHIATLITGDGTVQQKTIDNLKKCFAWDGADPFWLMAENPEETDQSKWTPRDLSACELEIVGGPNEYQTNDGETKVNFKVQWLNPAGSSGAAMPTAADRKSIMAKFGSKLRALAGPAASKAKPAAAAAKKDEPKKAEPTKATTTPASGAAAKSKSSGPPKPAPKQAEQQELGESKATESTMEEAWAALVAARSDLGEAEQGEMWYAQIEALFPGKNNDDLTPENFGQLKAHFESVAA